MAFVSAGPLMKRIYKVNHKLTATLGQVWC